MQKQTTFFLLLFWTLFANAQDGTLHCGHQPAGSRWEEVFQQLIHAYHSEQHGEAQRTLRVVPIVFHVVHAGEPVGIYPNIQAGQILSQLTVLNSDFAGHAYNASNYPLNAFINWAANQGIAPSGLDSLGRIQIADFDIQFCPASTDPAGNTLTEPGINRINYLDKGWPAPDLYPSQSSMKGYLDSIVKPGSIWDVTKYMNVWLTDKNNQLTYGGVSSVPPLSGLPDIVNGADSTTDGIWCYTKVIGSSQLFPQGTYAAPLIDGRTLTHEAGHYFGLRHIWGDQPCGNDFCSDTPPAVSENTGNPQYPWQSGSCSNPSNQPDGEMFMNFMDYTIGPAKYMFTPDQKIRARTALLNSPFRNQLGTHGLCDNASSLQVMGKGNRAIARPNPVKSQVSIEVPRGAIRRMEVYTLQGVLLKTFNDPEFSMEEMCAGLYLLHIYTEKELFTIKLIRD